MYGSECRSALNPSLLVLAPDVTRPKVPTHFKETRDVILGRRQKIDGNVLL